MLRCRLGSRHRGLKIGVRITATPACRCPRPEQRALLAPANSGRDRATACLRPSRRPPADIPGETMNNTNGVTPRAWKMIGVHQTMDNAVPAAPNPRAAQVRGDPLRTVATSAIDKGPNGNLMTLRTSWASNPHGDVSRGRASVARPSSRRSQCLIHVPKRPPSAV